MPRNYDSIDLDFTWDGDFLVDSQGDLKDTKEDILLSFRNEVFTVIKSSLKDWREEPGVGASLDDFVGEPNVADTGKAIEQRVRSALIVITSANDLNVRVIPVGVHKVLITITIQVLATPENGLTSGEALNVSFLYDYFERGTFVPLDEMNKFSRRNI
jgi:hypothetical protein